MLKSNRFYKSEEPVMNRSKKLAITLAVLAVLGGSVYVQPEQALAAEYVIDGDAAFEALKDNSNNGDWIYSESKDEDGSINEDGDHHVALASETSHNYLVFKNIKNEGDNIRLGVAGGRGDDETSYNTLVIENSKIIASWIEGGYSYHNDALRLCGWDSGRCNRYCTWAFPIFLTNVLHGVRRPVNAAD